MRLYTNASLEVPYLLADQPGNRWGTGDIRIVEVQVLNGAGAPTEVFSTGDSVIIRLGYEVHSSVDEVVFWVCVTDHSGIKLSGTTITSDQLGIPLAPGSRGSIECKLESVPFLSGRYYLIVAAMLPGSTTAYDRWGQEASFVVQASSGDADPGILDSRLHGLVGTISKWRSV